MARPELACGRSGHGHTPRGAGDGAARLAVLLPLPHAAALGLGGSRRPGRELWESCPLQPGSRPDARPLLCTAVRRQRFLGSQEGGFACCEPSPALSPWVGGRAPLTGQGLCCPTRKSRVGACDRPRREAEFWRGGAGAPLPAPRRAVQPLQVLLKVGGAASPGCAVGDVPTCPVPEQLPEGSGRMAPYQSPTSERVTGEDSRLHPGLGGSQPLAGVCRDPSPVVGTVGG